MELRSAVWHQPCHDHVTCTKNVFKLDIESKFNSEKNDVGVTVL